MVASASMLFPLLDSPTIPRTSPWSMRNETLSRIAVAPRLRPIVAVSPSTESTVAAICSDLNSRVEHVPQTVTEKIETQYGHKNCQAREDRDPWSLDHEVSPVGNEDRKSKRLNS